MYENQYPPGIFKYAKYLFRQARRFPDPSDRVKQLSIDSGFFSEFT